MQSLTVIVESGMAMLGLLLVCLTVAFVYYTIVDAIWPPREED